MNPVTPVVSVVPVNPVMSSYKFDNLADVNVIRGYLSYLLSTSDYNAIINPDILESDAGRVVLHFVNEWFLNNKRQSEYHVYLMWFALRAIFANRSITVSPAIVAGDFYTHPWEFQNCFDVPVDWRDERELQRQFCKIAAIANSLIKKCLFEGGVSISNEVLAVRGMARQGPMER